MTWDVEKMIREGWLFRCSKCGCVGDWVCSCDGGNPTTTPMTAEEEIAAAHEMLNELGVITHIGPDQGDSGPITKLNLPGRLRQIAQPVAREAKPTLVAASDEGERSRADQNNPSMTSVEKELSVPGTHPDMTPSAHRRGSASR